MGSEIDNSKAQLRRAEKSWQYRNRELSDTHSLYAIFISLQAIIIGIYAIVFNQNHIFASIIGIVFSLAIVTMVLLFYLNAVSRELNCRRATYFEIITNPSKDWPADFQERQEDDDWKCDYKTYLDRRKWLEIIAFSALVINVTILWISLSLSKF